jgi:hypothetical protein
VYPIGACWCGGRGPANCWTIELEEDHTERAQFSLEDVIGCNLQFAEARIRAKGTGMLDERWKRPNAENAKSSIQPKIINKRFVFY